MFIHFGCGIYVSISSYTYVYNHFKLMLGKKTSINKLLKTNTLFIFYLGHPGPETPILLELQLLAQCVDAYCELKIRKVCAAIQGTDLLFLY